MVAAPAALGRSNSSQLSRKDESSAVICSNRVPPAVEVLRGGIANERELNDDVIVRVCVIFNDLNHPPDLLVLACCLKKKKILLFVSPHTQQLLTLRTQLLER